ncbi:MAG: DUF4838 domain-containing protein [Candidatus Solibacter usitatus]|nr:DUF4838 domain-containing protein [Candidatus Solibacter usitatus]
MKRLILTAVAGLLAYGRPATLTLAANGRTTYTIVRAKEASPSELRAASELQTFLNQITGARFEVVDDSAGAKGNLILLGRNRITDRLRLSVPFDKLGHEGFALKTAGKHLVIAGGRQRGTMYGVYAFLEKLGCRWVAPDAARIPKISSLKVPPLDETQTPDFEYREVYMGEAFDKDWAARNKTNGQSSALDDSTGGKIQYFPFVHSFYSIVPPDKYFKDHPEYFSLIDGKRRGEQAQLCLTNPDVLRISIGAVLGWIKQHPEATIFSVSQNDYGGQCECDNCRRVEQEEGGSAAGPLLRYVNAVAEAVGKPHPDKLIDTLAYFYSETPPAVTRPRRNVRVRMCPIGACNAHPYEKCPHNAYIVNNLKAWTRITSNVYVWHYNANFSHFLLPVPDFDELAADVPMYKRHGVAGLFMQGAYAAGSSDGALRAYVIARLLWNSKSDVWKAVDEFHDVYYGKAAQPMRAYLELVRNMARPAPQGEGQHWWCCRAPAFAGAQLAQANRLLTQAMAAADDDATRRHVLIAQMSLRYLELRRDQQFVVRDGRYEPRGLDSLSGRFNLFLADAERAGIRHLGEDGPKEMYSKQFLDSLKSHPVVTLKNAALKVLVVPELNGRVISIIDQRTQRELLNQPVPVEMNYPGRSGLSVSAYADFVNAPAYPVRWEVSSESGGAALTLVGTSPNGLRLRRLLRLAGDEARLQTETVVENGGADPIDVTLQSQFDGAPGPLEDAVVEFRAVDGKGVRKKLIEPDGQPAGEENYPSGQRPAGEWRAVHAPSGLTLVHAFPPEQADRATLAFSAKNSSRVTMSVWSPKRRLKPGEQLRLESEYSAMQR